MPLRPLIDRDEAQSYKKSIGLGESERKIQMFAILVIVAWRCFLWLKSSFPRLKWLQRGFTGLFRQTKQAGGYYYIFL